MTEALLRIVLGWRFLVSGVSNVRRWPNPVRTAGVVFPCGASFFGALATVLMVVGGLGVAAGLQTPVCAVMLAIFLIPTFAVHSYWLKTLPTLAPAVAEAIGSQTARDAFRTFDRQAYHAHEVGNRDNLVLLSAALYFAVRGSGALGLDNWLQAWVIRLF
jgi:uncharacterized membrane protein YphA (DoxX/SURF4 family)